MQPLTLYGFHHAGGSARAYNALSTHLPPWISPIFLDLPGHGRRRAEGLRADWGEVITDALSSIDTGGAYALFGHSMGGLLAVRLGQRLCVAGCQPPLWLGLAACRPHVRANEPDWLGCPDETVVARLRELGGTPPEILANDSLLPLLFPVLRADFALCAEERLEGAMLAAPITAMGGKADDISQTALTSWSKVTTGAFNLRMVAGDHFFPQHQPQMTATLITEEISRAIRL